MGKLRPSQFLEALLRCALVAYSKISTASISDKLKFASSLHTPRSRLCSLVLTRRLPVARSPTRRGLLLYMWRAMNDNVPKAFASRSVSTYAGNLMAVRMRPRGRDGTGADMCDFARAP